MSLRTNYVKFITHLDVDAVIPVMVAEGLLTRQEQAQLAEPGQTNRQRCEKILSYVPNKGRDFYYKFCCCIVWSGQTHLANLINFDMSTVPDPNKYLTAPVNPAHIVSRPHPLPATPSSTKTILVLYSKDHRLDSAPDLSLHQRRSADRYCQEIYNLVYTLNLFSTVEREVGGVTQAYRFSYDLLEAEKGYVPNFLSWFESQLELCDIVLLLCSPTMGMTLKGEIRADLIEMEKGQLSSHSLINALPHKKVLPVFLNMPSTVSWLPFSLRGTPSYEVDFNALQEGMGGVTEAEFAGRAYLLLERDPRLKGFLELIRTLRKEEDEEQPMGPPPIELSIPEPPVPARFLDEIAPKVIFIWERLGTRLGLEFHDLERIRVECNSDYEGATRKMFAKWQRTKGSEATPEVLIQALTNLNYRAVAEKFRDMMKKTE